MAQLPFQNAILKIESKEKERASRALFFLCSEASMVMLNRQADPAEELSDLRRKISELVARNAVPMVQQAIDAVREEGQYQAIKYLFEMIGLYPANAQDDAESQDSLAQVLLEQLGLAPPPPGKQAPHRRAKAKDRHPVE